MMRTVRENLSGRERRAPNLRPRPYDCVSWRLLPRQTWLSHQDSCAVSPSLNNQAFGSLFRMDREPCGLPGTCERSELRTTMFAYRMAKYLPLRAISAALRRLDSAILSPALSRYPFATLLNELVASSECVAISDRWSRWRSVPRSSGSDDLAAIPKSMMNGFPSSGTITFDVVRSPCTIPAEWRKPTCLPNSSRRGSRRESLIVSIVSLATCPSTNVMIMENRSMSSPRMLGALVPAILASWIADDSLTVLSFLIFASSSSWRYAFRILLLTTAFQGGNSDRKRSASAPLCRG